MFASAESYLLKDESSELSTRQLETVMISSAHLYESALELDYCSKLDSVHWTTNPSKTQALSRIHRRNFIVALLSFIRVRFSHFTFVFILTVKTNYLVTNLHSLSFISI